MAPGPGPGRPAQSRRLPEAHSDSVHTTFNPSSRGVGPTFGRPSTPRDDSLKVHFSETASLDGSLARRYPPSIPPPPPPHLCGVGGFGITSPRLPGDGLHLSRDTRNHLHTLSYGPRHHHVSHSESPPLGNRLTRRFISQTVPPIDPPAPAAAFLRCRGREGRQPPALRGCGNPRSNHSPPPRTHSQSLPTRTSSAHDRASARRVPNHLTPTPNRTRHSNAYLPGSFAGSAVTTAVSVSLGTWTLPRPARRRGASPPVTPRSRPYLCGRQPRDRDPLLPRSGRAASKNQQLGVLFALSVRHAVSAWLAAADKVRRDARPVPEPCCSGPDAAPVGWAGHPARPHWGVIPPNPPRAAKPPPQHWLWGPNFPTCYKVRGSGFAARSAGLNYQSCG